MGLADLAHVRTMLAASGTMYDPNHDKRLEALDAAITVAVQDRAGRAWGGAAATPTTRALLGEDGPLLVLPEPARVVSAVTVDGTALALDAYAYRLTADGLIAALALGDGSWWGAGAAVEVTATWASDDAGDGVPGDVQYCIDFLVAEYWKRENAGPAGFTGPEGATVPLRDPWKDPLVVATLARYRVPSLVL